MTNKPLPALYLSHGSPMIAIEPGAAGVALQALGRTIDHQFGRPRAIVSVSPHTSARQLLVLGAARHPTVHDFGGFPQALFEVEYPAAGEPALASRVVDLLRAAELTATLRPEGGLDHGHWSVLRHMWPAAEVPIVPLALLPHATPAEQWAIGAALAPLTADGVLIVASGSATHNLGRWMRDGAARDAPAATDAQAFADWVAARVAAGDVDALLDYRRAAPHAQAMHPTDEHWLPFYIAAGAGGVPFKGLRIYRGMTHAALSMDQYAFGPQADALLAALQASADQAVLV